MSVSVGVDCHEVKTIPANNTSSVYLKIWVTTSGDSYNEYTCYGSIWFNGEKVDVEYTLPKNTSTVVYEGTKEVSHDNNGNGSCSWGYSLPTTPSGGTKEDEGSISLSHIDRYLSITEFKVQSKKINSLVVKWATSDPRSATYFSINNGEWQGSATYQESVSTDKKSGTFLIKNLSPNTKYSLKIKCVREGSGLATTSNSIQVTTYDIAKIVTLSNFEHGSNAIVVITNPASISNLNLEMKIGNTQILSRTISEGENTISFSDAELDNIYKKYENENTLVATFIVSGEEYSNSKECTIVLKGNQKTIKTNINNVYKRGKVLTNVANVWKRGIVWTNENGSWRRCG